MTPLELSPPSEPVTNTSWNWLPRTAFAIAIAVAAVSATAAGEPTGRPASAAVARTGGAGVVTELAGESGPSAEMVRLVPEAFRTHGPDVAKWQHPHGKPINWAAAKRSGAGYAFMKATEGTTVVNPWFRADWSGAARAGLPRGAYHFARPALPISTATAQAHAYLRVVGTLHRPGDMPAVLDLESTGGLTPGQLILWAQQWVRTVQDATGRAPILYTYRSFWKNRAANSSALTHLPLWLADYSDGHAGAGRLTGPTRPLVGHWQDWAIWQWTDRGRVAGVAAPVDVNVFNGGAKRMRELADGARHHTIIAVRPGPALRVRAKGGDHSVTVSWMPGFDGNSRPTGWRVTVEGTDRSVVVSGHSLSVRVRGLQNGKTYAVRVEQRNAAGWSEVSAAAHGSTSPAVSITGLLLAAHTAVAGETVPAVAQVRVDGVPLPGVRVEFWAERGHRAVRLGAVKSDAEGNASADITVSATTKVQARFAGLPRTYGSHSGWARVVALPRLEVAVPVSADNGRPMAIGGSALGAPRGSAVVLQQWTKRGWAPVGKAHVKSGGRFVFVLKAARGVRKYRVVVPATTVTGRVASPSSPTTIS